MKNFRVDPVVRITLPEVGTPEYDTAVELLMDSGLMGPEEFEEGGPRVDHLLAEVLALESLTHQPAVTDSNVIDVTKIAP